MSTLPLSLRLLEFAADITGLALAWLVQSTVILALGLAGGWVLARRGPALQSALYRTTLVAAAACPLVAWLLASMGAGHRLMPTRMDVVAMRAETLGNARDSDAEESASIAAGISADAATVSARGSATENDTRPERDERFMHDDPAGAAQLAAGPSNANVALETGIGNAAARRDMVAAARSRENDSHSAAEAEWQVRTAPAILVVTMALVWLLAALVLLGRLCVGLSRMRRICRGATAAASSEQLRLAELAGRIGVRPPQLLRTPLVTSPCVAGLFRPVILLPDEPTGVPLSAVLVHELAHLRRGDHVWNFGARVVMAVLWFQPLLRQIVRRLEIAAEEVCDDHVVHFGVDRARYANGLVTLAERSMLPPASAGVPLVTLRSLLARRVQRILNHRGPALLSVGRPAVCGVICAGLLVTALGGLFGASGHADASFANAANADDRGADRRDEDGDANQQDDATAKTPTAPATKPPASTAGTISAEKATDDDALPAGAIARLGTTRFRPPNGGETVSFLPENGTLTLLTRDGALEYWNAQSGRFLREVQVAKRWIPVAEPTPDGRFIAAYGRGMDDVQRRHVQWVALFDAAAGRELTRLELDDWSDGPLAVAANGSVLATAYKDIKIINVNTGEVHDLKTEPVRAQSLALSPDGTLLAAGSSGLVRLWNWRARQEPRYFAIAGKDVRNKPGVAGLTFSFDGSLLAASDREYGVSLIDLRSGEETHRLSMDGISPWQSNHPVFSPNGKLLAAPIRWTVGGGVAVWDVESGKLAKRLEMPHESVTHIAFSSDSRLLAGSNWWESLLCVWNVESGELLGRDLAGHKSPPNTLRFLPDDERLASAGDDGTMHLWGLQYSKPERVIKHEPDLNGHVSWIRAMDVSPDGKFITSSSFDDTVRLWELATGREVHRLPGPAGNRGGHRAVGFTSDSRRLASWGDDMRITVYDVASGRKIADHLLKPTGLQATGAGPANRSGLANPRDRDSLHLERGVLSPDASRLAVAIMARDAPRTAARLTTYVFDVETGSELIDFDLSAGSRVSGLAISPDNQFLLLVGQEQSEEIQLADGQTTRETIHWAQLRRLSNGELVGELNREDGGWAQATFSPDSQRMAIPIGSAEPRVVIVKIPELTEITRIDGFRATPRALEFSHSGKLLAVSNGDTSIVVYDLDKLP